MVYQSILESTKNNKKLIGILIDPDKSKTKNIKQTLRICVENKVDFFLIGGSLISSDVLSETIYLIKETTKIPIIIFPGSVSQIDESADAILLLSLISGRNPDLLIGKHVEVASYLNEINLEILPTGYMLIDGGKNSTVQYISNTNPIPADKTDIAVCTALAGTQLGFKIIYLDAGSGAKNNISPKMIKAVAKNISVPLIIGGGIHKAKTLKKIYKAGADLVVLGTIIEKSPKKLYDLCEVRNLFNSKISMRKLKN